MEYFRCHMRAYVDNLIEEQKQQHPEEKKSENGKS